MADVARITRALGHLEVSLTRTALDDFASFAKGAQREFSGDMFHMSHTPSREVFVELGERGVKQRYLADPEGLDDLLAHMEGTGAQFTSYGEMPLKNHAKAYVKDGSEAFFTTGAFTRKTPDRFEFVARFDGEAAKAVQAVTDAQIGGNVQAMRNAAKHASTFGIVYNDARSGSTFLTDTLYDMVRKAEHRVAVSTKIMNDPRMRKLLDQAVDRGVEVGFTDIRSNGMHGNLVVADDSVYLGTAHMSPRSLGDMRYAYRQSRELGIVQHDAQLAQRMLDRIDEIGMPRYTPEEFSESAALRAHMDAPIKQDERIARLAEKGEVLPKEGERLIRLQAAREEAIPQWKELWHTVKERRAQDGLTFGNLPTRPPAASSRRDIPLVPFATGGGIAATVGGGFAVKHVLEDN